MDTGVLNRVGAGTRELGLETWAVFVLALAVGRLFAGGRNIELDELVVGLPLSWLTVWAEPRLGRAANIAAAAGIVLVGLAIGLLM